jgi:hypothetical protein
MSETWYEMVEAASPLTQGDLLFDCPLLTWDPAALRSAGDVVAPGALKDSVSAFREDVVVMTQACDLEHRKVENVVLCPHVPLTTFRRVWQEWMTSKKQNPSEKAWKRTCEDVANGYVWNQAFLNRSDHPGLITEIRVVDFHDVFTVPRSFLEALLQTRQSPRLRLLPPYREHLSQAFARFFMRVGLPQPVDPAW